MRKYPFHTTLRNRLPLHTSVKQADEDPKDDTQTKTTADTSTPSPPKFDWDKATTDALGMGKALGGVITNMPKNINRHGFDYAKWSDSLTPNTPKNLTSPGVVEKDQRTVPETNNSDIIAQNLASVAKADTGKWAKMKHAVGLGEKLDDDQKWARYGAPILGSATPGYHDKDTFRYVDEGLTDASTLENRRLINQARNRQWGSQQGDAYYMRGPSLTGVAAVVGSVDPTTFKNPTEFQDHIRAQVTDYLNKLSPMEKFRIGDQVDNLHRAASDLTEYGDWWLEAGDRRMASIYYARGAMQKEAAEEVEKEVRKRIATTRRFTTWGAGIMALGIPLMLFIGALFKGSRPTTIINNTTATTPSYIPRGYAGEAFGGRPT